MARGPAVSIRWHDSGMPFHSSRRTASPSVNPGRRANSRFRTPCDVCARRVLNAASCSTSLMMRRPSPGSMSSPVAFPTEPAGPTGPRSSSTRKAGSFDRVRRGIRLPADDADSRPGTDPLLVENSGQRPRAVARLARKAQVLEPVTPHRERRRAGGPPVLVADEDRRLAGLGRRRGSPPRTAGRSRSGTTGSRCARDLRRRPGGRQPAPAMRSRRRSSRSAWSDAGSSGASSGIPKSGRSIARSRLAVTGSSTASRRRSHDRA